MKSFDQMGEYYEKWEAAEKRMGELSRQLKSERELNDLTIAELQAESDRRLALLRWLEWIRDNEVGGYFCPSCKGWKDTRPIFGLKGHTYDCELAAECNG